MEKKPKTTKIVPASFRDPSGFVFNHNSSIYRQINTSYRDEYDYLMNSGCYEYLVGNELLISHTEVDMESPISGEKYKIIRPELIPFISYPYEWSFSQLKHAALITLKIQKKALDFALSLKDCTAYNIQFIRGKPIFIDTLYTG